VALYHPQAMGDGEGILKVRLGSLVKVRLGSLAALAAALVVAGSGLGAAAAPARASTTERSILMDDEQLIYASPAHVEASMEQMAKLGIDTVKVSVVWSLVAPDATARRAPHFDATDPNAYPDGAWARYDLVDELAHQLGLGLYFQLTAPAPDWAVQPGARGPEHFWSHEPNPTEFGEFAEAVGRRYNGSFVPPAGTPDPLVSLPFGLSLGTTAGTGSFTSQPLPPVTWWGIWNEPNEHAWLSPQLRRYHGRTVPFSPLLERRLTDAGYGGLVDAGHVHDTILIGELASGGSVEPIPFVRDLYCLGPRYRPLRGSAAAALGCPASGSGADFVDAHPALFHAAGFAHHPYSFDHEPNTPFASAPATITLANLGALERALDRSLRAYRQRAGMPFYLTEWGYKTNPPNPFVHTSLSQQATWLNEGEYMSWRDPRVKALAQYLLYDSLPRQGAAPGTLSYWSTFQSGLYYHDGRAKPSLDAFRLPIWLPRARPGRRVTVWAELRPAKHTGPQSGVIDFRASPAASWTPLVTVQTANSEGFVLAHVNIPRRGMIRLAWSDPASGAVDYSRTVPIR
jgi:hypothetical protein